MIMTQNFLFESDKLSRWIAHASPFCTEERFIVSRRVKFLEGSQTNIGWTEEFCRHSRRTRKMKITHTLLSWQERDTKRWWKRSINSQKGPHSSNSITNRLSRSIAKVSLRCRKGSSRRLDTNSIQRFLPIFKSHNTEGNNSSDTEIPVQIMPQQKSPINASRGAGQPVACPVDRGSGWISWWAILQLLVVIFPIHGRHIYRKARAVSALSVLFKIF